MKWKPCGRVKTHRGRSGVIDRPFWSGKRVFLTGDTGFKGSWMAELLTQLGAAVKGYALEPPTDPSLFRLSRLENRLQHVDGNILDGAKLAEEVRVFNPEIVIHLAAQPLVRRSYLEPRLTYETNVMGTLNLYEAVRSSTTVRVVISVTTDKCYQNNEWVWGYREDDRLGGKDPYSSSKACAELLSAAYRASFFNPDEYGKSHRVSLSTVRAGNVIGGGDWATDRLIPDCVRSLARGETLVVRSPKAVRPWQHVLEPLVGYLTLAQKMWSEPLQFGQGWNFGPAEESTETVEQVVRRIFEVWGKGKFIIAADRGPYEARTLRLDTSKARHALGWKPILSFADGIDWTTSWYRSFYEDRADAEQLTKRQAATYLKRLEK